jgi:hypothetical protein
MSSKQINDQSKRLLVNGCSFSRGPGSWPYFLSGYDVVNLAQAGAGNIYIHETTIAELTKRSYDFVVVMWSGLHRIDLKVADISLFSESTCTSQYQHQQNDWPEKIIIPVNDQDYVEKDWVFGCGGINKDSVIRKSKIFEQIHKYVDESQFVYGCLIKMISLQNVLKQMKIPYLFTFYQDYEETLKMYPSLYNALDHIRIYNQENIYNITKKNNWFADDNIHPGIPAHQAWASLIQPKIDEIYEAN